MKKYIAYILILVWLATYIIVLAYGTEAVPHGMGINRVKENGEYYRLFTAIFLHFKFKHILANLLGYFFIVHYLLKILPAWQIPLFGVITGMLEETVFSIAVHPNHDHGVGGSSITFALIGLIVIIRIMRPETAPLDCFRITKDADDETLIVIGSLEGNRILVYSI